jgi:hypothetical protein
MAFWGNPITSGSHQIDYFISADVMEHPHRTRMPVAHEAYSEQVCVCRVRITQLHSVGDLLDSCASYILNRLQLQASRLVALLFRQHLVLLRVVHAFLNCRWC